MAELKTQPNEHNVDAFLGRIEDEGKRSDSLELVGLMREVTNAEPQMWGNSIVGFGTYHYKYPTGREGDWFLVGFSPRKQNLTLYIVSGIDRYEELTSTLGKFKTGKSCLYVKRLNDIDREVLRELVERSVEHAKQLDGKLAY